MKKKLLIFFLLFSLVNDLEASPQKKIISKFETVNNLAFNFDQIIGESQETGNCIVEYSKKFIASMILFIIKFWYQMVKV